MSEQGRNLLEKALRLPLRERSELAAKLLRSLDDEEKELSPEEWERVWSAEIKRRLRDIDEGRTKTIDGDEALRRARQVLKKRRR